MLTSVGWCAGRPGDHDVDTEQEVAARQLRAYPGTTALRDFRGSSAPSAGWWNTQTCAAFQVAHNWDAIPPRSVDVVFSWTPQEASVDGLIGSIPPWVRRVFLLGNHEPEVKISPDAHLEQFRSLREQLGPRRADARVQLGPAYILYRARIGAPADVPDYIEPLVVEDLIDFIAWDGYPSYQREQKPTNPSSYENPASFSDLPRVWRLRTGLPYAWAELHHGRVAGDDGRQCAAWHAGVYRQAREDGAPFVTQFHYNNGDFLAPAGGPARLPEMDGWAAVIAEASAAHRAYRMGQENGDESATESAYRSGWNNALTQVDEEVQNTINLLRVTG